MDPRAGAAALQTIGKAVRALSRVPSRAAASAAPKIEALVREEFARGLDPYGNPWIPLKRSTLDKGRRPPPLTDTGALATVTARPTSGAGIAVELGAEYGAFHQVGTRSMVARPPLPIHGLPAKWRAAIEASVQAAVK